MCRGKVGLSSPSPFRNLSRNMFTVTNGSKGVEKADQVAGEEDDDLGSDDEPDTDPDPKDPQDERWHSRIPSRSFPDPVADSTDSEDIQSPLVKEGMKGDKLPDYDDFPQKVLRNAKRLIEHYILSGYAFMTRKEAQARSANYILSERNRLIEEMLTNHDGVLPEGIYSELHLPKWTGTNLQCLVFFVTRRMRYLVG